jgi:hypothetical protein
MEAWEQVHTGDAAGGGQGGHALGGGGSHPDAEMEAWKTTSTRGSRIRCGRSGGGQWWGRRSHSGGGRGGGTATCSVGVESRGAVGVQALTARQTGEA